MPSISSQSLFSTVTSEFAVRKVQNIDPKRFNQTIFQISDQQSRDKNYEKGLEYLRTYIASLQAKANALIEELNGIYENMLSDTLFRRADTKDTAQLLNRLPNADQNSCAALSNTYNPKDLEITPYDQNVRFYSYNPLFGSRALDMQNYYNLSGNTDTSISRAYYESTQGLHHELGASAFSTLSYLWMWDLDRINASYATTKDSYVDESGVLHVAPGDSRVTQAALNAGIIVEDPTLAIAGGGDPNKLQVNVTALQPNRLVFFPDDDSSISQVDLLKVTVEEAQPLAGWITLSDFSGSDLILDTNASGGNATKQYANPNASNLSAYWKDLMQWGVDDTDMISNNPFPPGNPPPIYNEDTAGYNSRRSFQFGNTKVVTYGGVTYAPHSNYIFEPEVINETFDNPIDESGGSIFGTRQAGWSATGNTGLIGNDGAGGNDTIQGGATQVPGGTPYANSPDPTGNTPPDNLNLSYFWTSNNGSAHIYTPKFNLSDFEDIDLRIKSYYRISSYGQKRLYDVDGDYGDSDLDLDIREISKPSNSLQIAETGTGNTWFMTADPAPGAPGPMYPTFYGYATDPYPDYFFSAPQPTTNGQFVTYSYQVPVGTNNMGFDFYMKELSRDAGYPIPSGIITGGVDFRRGQLIVPNSIYLNHPARRFTPPTHYEGNIYDYATSTRWQIDDVYMKATGFVRGELISPPVDFTNMESGFLEFYDRIETSPTNTIEKKQVWYSFDYDEINKTGTWQLLMQKPQADQGWQKNEVEIPCVADQQNVRVKFVFDTRQNTNIRTSASGNIQNDTDYDGWNIDDIRLFGVKVDPTDFYYYRQDLDSEFVTGTGPRVSASTVPIAGLQGIQPAATRVDTDSTKLSNTYTATGNTASDNVRFEIKNIVSTATTTPITFNVNAAVNTMGRVTQSYSAAAPVTGPHYQALLVSTNPSTVATVYPQGSTGAGIVNRLTGVNPYLTSNLSAGDTIKVNGWEYTIHSVSGTTTNPTIIINPYLTKGDDGILVTNAASAYYDTNGAGFETTISSPSANTPATVALMSKPTSPATISSRQLEWDITGSTSSGSSSSASFDFKSVDVDDVTNGYTNVSLNDPWAYITNANAIDRINDQVRSGTLEKPIEMVDDTPLGATYSSTQNAKSVKSINGFTGQFGPSDTVTVSFNHYGNSPGFLFNRRFRIYDSGGGLVSEREYDSLIGGVSATQSEFITLTTAERDALNGGGRFEFLAESPDGLRTVFPTNIEDWVIQNFKVDKTDAPLSQTYTSSLESGLYNVTQSNTKFSFEYSAVDDTTGNISDTKRKVYMYSSTDGGATFGAPVEILNVAVQTGSTPSFVSTGPIGMATGTTVKFKFETEITVPSGVTVAPRNDVFQIRNLEMQRYDGDGYNLAETPNAPYDAQRPNISFDARRSNLQGKYTVVNDRNQVTNTDFPMFANAFLTYIEQDSNISNSRLTETYVDWVGNNDMPPARVVDAITGKVKSQTEGNFIQRDDGLSQMYDTNATGGIQDFFVDDAMAINTGRLTKPTSVDDINKNKTGWVNAQNLGGNKIWFPYTAGTKYDEGNGTYKSQTIWGKRTFLTDTVNSNASLTISSNDDAFLYVNGYNVKSTAYAQVGSGAGALIDMIDASDYYKDEYVMINGEINRISNIIGPSNNTLVLNGGTNFGLGTFDDSTSGQPATVYHVDLPLDTSGNAITVVGTTIPDKIQLSSLNQINIGQTITIDGENYKISATNIATNTITVTPANLSINPIPNNSIVYFGISDKGPASNPSAPGGGSVNTNSMSPSSTYNVAPLLRAGFNSVGFKASEDRGTGDGVVITSSNITAIGDTNGPNGINTDSRWAVKIQEKGYDGVVPVGTSTVNPYSNSLSNSEIVELFKSEITEKKELTVKFINQDQNGIGKLSHIQSVDVTVTGEPLVGTFKTTNYSTEQFIDGLVTTQLTKGYIRGVAQDGNGAALVFDPTNASDPDNPTSAPATTTTGLRYTTGTDGLADISVFLEKDDNIVNDATLMVKVDYYEDGNGDGIIDGDTNENGLIDNGETGTLKTKYVGMQDLRANLPSNPKGNSAGGAIGSGPNAIVDRYKYAEASLVGAIALGGTVLNVPVADIGKFNIGDDIKIINGANNQTVRITAINTGTGQITFQPYTGTGLGFATAGATTVSTNKALSDVDQSYAIRMYSGSDKFNIGANTSVHSMNITATNGRSGGADVTGNQNKLTKRLKEVLDNAEYTDVIKYGLLDEIYIAATASDNRGDQVVGKLVLNWDWQRKRLGLTQGSFSAVYKS